MRDRRRKNADIINDWLNNIALHLIKNKKRPVYERRKEKRDEQKNRSPVRIGVHKSTP
jgi:hypothetical protein